jgi:eukaryotic-like serine/threonine-protein kinase
MLYETATPIGQGAMGRVYRAWDNDRQCWVALKYLRVNDPDWARRMRREAQVQSRLDHPNIARIYHVGEDQGQVYIAMEFIDGRPLDELIGEISLEAGVRLLVDCADAVQSAHAAGLVHRDLKPANILVAEPEEGRLHPYVLDFGLVLNLDDDTLTAAGDMLGTPGYMAPEQAAGRRAEVDRRSDVYSLGCVLYQLLTGKPPFADSSRTEILRRLMNEDVRPPRRLKSGVPRALERICLQCLERRPARRYDSAARMRDDLRRWLDGDPVNARPVGLGWTLGRFARRNRLATGLGAIAILAVVTAVGIGWHGQHQSELRAAQAQRTGEALKDMEWRLRGAFMTPDVDITWHKQSLGERVESLSRELTGLGEAGQAQAAYALGRSYLLLDQPESAIEQLSNPPVRTLVRDTDFWAGYALALLYRQAQLELTMISDPDLRRQRQLAAESELRDRALTLLTATGDEVENPEFRDALVAWLQEQPEQAVELARASRRDRPWFFEAVMLEADILLSRHVEERLAGEYERAAERLSGAAVSIRRATDIAPSAPHLLARACDTVRMADEINTLSSASAELPSNLDLDICQQLTELEPGDGRHQARLARARSARWNWLAQKATPPVELADQAIAAARQALVLEPDNAEVLMHSARTISDLGFGLRDDGDLALELLQESLEVSRHLIELRPSDALVFSAAGSNARRLATLLHRRGQDPTRALEEAVDFLRQAVALAPDHPYPRHNLAFALKSLATHGDPDHTAPIALLEEAIEQGLAALAINPRDPVILNTMGNIHSDLGRESLGIERPAEIHFEKAMAFYTSATELNPGYRMPYNNQANVARIMAEHYIKSDDDPSQWLARGSEAANAALALNPDYSLAWFNLGGVYLLDASYRVASGESPIDSAERAMNAFSRGLELTSTVLGGWINYAEAALILGNSDDATDQQRLQARLAIERAYDQIAKLAPGHIAIVRLDEELSKSGWRHPTAP